MYDEVIEVKPDIHVGMLFLFLSVTANETCKLLLKTGLLVFPSLKVKRRSSSRWWFRLSCQWLSYIGIWTVILGTMESCFAIQTTLMFFFDCYVYSFSRCNQSINWCASINKTIGISLNKHYYFLFERLISIKYFFLLVVLMGPLI